MTKSNYRAVGIILDEESNLRQQIKRGIRRAKTECPAMTEDQQNMLYIYGMSRAIFYGFEDTAYALRRELDDRYNITNWIICREEYLKWIEPYRDDLLWFLDVLEWSVSPKCFEYLGGNTFRKMVGED